MKGERVYLHADIPPQTRQWRNDFAIWRWCRQYSLIDETRHKAWLERISLDESIKMFGIYSLKDDRALGVCGLTSIDRVNQNAEFSLYIAKQFWGLGFGLDSLRLLLRHGFEDQNLVRIWGETYESNPAINMFYKLGMKLEGTKRKAYFRSGRFIDCHVVSILREEFQ